MHNQTAVATSSGVTRRLIGCLACRIDRASASVRPVLATISAIVFSVIGVSTYAGQTALTVTPVSASSAAGDRTSPRTPGLLAVYAAMYGSPLLAATDAMT